MTLDQSSIWTIWTNMAWVTQHIIYHTITQLQLQPKWTGKPKVSSRFFFQNMNIDCCHLLIQRLVFHSGSGRKFVFSVDIYPVCLSVLCEVIVRQWWGNDNATGDELGRCWFFADAWCVTAFTTSVRLCILLADSFLQITPFFVKMVWRLQ